MKKIFIVISSKRLYWSLAFITVTALLLSAFVYITAFIHVIPAYDGIEEQEIAGLEKVNSRLKGILENIIPEDNRIIYEDQYRNQFLNAKGYLPPSFETFPLQDVLKNGDDVKYNVLSKKPYYLRPLYDPDWKGAYYRKWSYLPTKNIEARHKLFIYPSGGSSIYDFTGTQGLDDGTAVDYHRNINFLIYGFDVKNIKYYENQVALIGEPLRQGLQVVSIVQNDLLPGDINTRDILIHLSTPQGFEIDFVYGNLIKYEYLKKQIEENTVKAFNAEEDMNATIDQLLNENLYLKKELSYFVPVEDKRITQEKCKSIPPNFTFDPDIETIKLKGREITINKNYLNNKYKRPVHDPMWLKNYKERWCFIPKQICYNQHKLFLIPEDPKEQYNFFCILGFHESFVPIKDNEFGYLLYNFQTSKAIIYEDQVLFIGTPSRNGAEIISINLSSISNDQIYLVRMVTPDDQELDYVVMDNS